MNSVRATSLTEIDSQLLEINRRGVSMDCERVRVRLRLRLSTDDKVLLIVPIWNDGSTSFRVLDSVLYSANEAFAAVLEADFDDAVLSYPRNGGRCLTLNTNSRSQCTGCVFCHYSLEETQDPRIPEGMFIHSFVNGLLYESRASDLIGVERIGLSTGCFVGERSAVDHVVALSDALAERKFTGAFHFLSSVVRSHAALSELAARVPNFHLVLTVECIENRSLLLKPSKASLSADDAVRVLARCRDVGVGCDFTYIAGLDRLSVALPRLKELCLCVTEFPKIQVFQPHAAYMRELDVSEADGTRFYERFKSAIVGYFASTPLRPSHWHNYRSPWTMTFGDEVLARPVI